MNQSGWQSVAVREPVKVISHSEPGQDLDGPGRREKSILGLSAKAPAAPHFCLKRKGEKSFNLAVHLLGYGLKEGAPRLIPI